MGTEGGRTYAGGLVKFEPREIERILLPPIEKIHDYFGEGETAGKAIDGSGNGLRQLPSVHG
jgi:hypothetical protein